MPLNIVQKYPLQGISFIIMASFSKASEESFASIVEQEERLKNVYNEDIDEVATNCIRSYRMKILKRVY